MKADWCGTITEQHRFSVDWKPYKKKERIESCIDCRHCKKTGQRTFKCVTHDFATSKGAVCETWEGGKNV